MKLYTKELVKKYRQRTVAKNVSVEVNQGEIIGLLGPNGAGKTTTFYMIVGLIKPFSGKVFLDEKEITDMPMYKRAQLGIGYLAQEASVFRHLSVEDNLRAVMQFTSMSKKEQADKLESLLNEFGLQHIRKSKGIQLSGGERRRTEIARALAVSPNFILLDEPFAGVDPIAVEDIQSIVSKLKLKNIGILITDHNVHETLSIVDPIPEYEKQKTALVVIDVQEGTTGKISADMHYVDQSADLIRKINAAIATAYEKGIPVIYIQQQTENRLLNWADGYYLAEGHPGVALDKRLKIVSLNQFTKRKSDAFSSYAFEKFLNNQQINRLLITGLDIAYCAGRTSKAALNRGYKVVVIEDAVISETEELKIESLEELRSLGASTKKVSQISGLLEEN
ncbi:MAG: LPS export ABC transporter ATP-binding protein [bacterium]